MSFSEEVELAAKLINESDAILIGAGAGLSAAAGLLYSGERFTSNFADFIEKYGPENMPDMYTSGFYPFATEEEKWGYWSKHALVNRVFPGTLPLYNKLFDLVKNKNYFVLTTNVDHQFWQAGFDDKRIFATQGDYGQIQCEKGCHAKVYEAIELFTKMDTARKDCKIPSDMVPKCPVCGGPMAMHLRSDEYFVQDSDWYAAAERYNAFLDQMKGKRAVLLELGVGFNTPGIIRFPFEKMTFQNELFHLIRINKDSMLAIPQINDRSILIKEDITTTINSLVERCSK